MNSFKKYFYIPVIILIITIIIVLIGCNKPSSINIVTENTIEAIEIKSILITDVNTNFYNFYCADANYSLPTYNWIQNEFSIALNEFLTSFKSSYWQKEELDCDNFAMLSFSFAQILHHNTKNKIKDTALSFGVFWYIKKEGGQHAINIILCFENNNYSIYFYEPQYQKFINLTKEEIKSAMFVLF